MRRRCECCAQTKAENLPGQVSVSTTTRSAYNGTYGALLPPTEWSGGAPKSDHRRDSEVIAGDGRNA